MKHLVLCLALIAAAVTPCLAQTPEQAKKAEAVLMKMRQVDVLVQVVPLLLTKEQIMQLLPAIEKARAKVAEAKKQEAAELDKLDGRLTDAVKKSIASGVPPPKPFLDEVAHVTYGFRV